jgi:hypothetical protein
VTYRAGLGLGMASLGFTPGPPHLRCDGCGLVLEAVTQRGGPPSWLLNRKAPKGWKMIRNDDGTRRDWCPRCKDTPAASDGGPR